MDCATLISNALSAGAGAFAGALTAYFLACRQQNQHEISEYLSLLLMIHEQLDAIYKIFSDIPPESVKEVDGEKIVEFTMPFPIFALTPQQMQTLMKIAPDKQMPSALIQFSNFLKMHSVRLLKGDVNIYEQQTNAAFPIE